ncbi:MAG: hypothetical protein HYX32_14395 [Actinobacteria bacterium]|nr:hypothetical protein [Actinomycetota bacterium]
MRIAYVGGFWATNIGNAFYNLGALHALRAADPSNQVFLIPDLASWHWNSENAYDVVTDVDVDLWVFSGPFFCGHIERFVPVFNRIRGRGGRFGFVSVGASSYLPDEWALVRGVLDSFGDTLAFVSTRDAETFGMARELSCPVHDGICTSMFLDEAVSVPYLDRPPYIVLNFNAKHEPIVRWTDERFEVTARQRSTQKRGRVARALGRPEAGAAGAHPYPRSVGPYDVLRTRSEELRHNPATLFDRPNVHYSDVPYGYLSIYRSAEVVFSDRVHTCASTLILGGTAQYVTTTTRSRDGRRKLLERVGAAHVFSAPGRLDRTAVEGEKLAMTAFLRACLSGVRST